MSFKKKKQDIDFVNMQNQTLVFCVFLPSHRVTNKHDQHTEQLSFISLAAAYHVRR